MTTFGGPLSAGERPAGRPAGGASRRPLVPAAAGSRAHRPALHLHGAARSRPAAIPRTTRSGCREATLANLSGLLNRSSAVTSQQRRAVTWSRW
jgi:hypothetical protein